MQLRELRGRHHFRNGTIRYFEITNGNMKTWSFRSHT
jgi:hypothetical protein